MNISYTNFIALLKEKIRRVGLDKGSHMKVLEK